MTDRTQQRTCTVLLAMTAALLLVLPFVTTFNDFLTVGAIRLGLSGPLQAVVPAEVRMVAGFLSLLGIQAAAHGSQIVLGGHQALYLSWNCVGWQSLILFGLSLVSGLRSGQRLEATLQLVLIGLTGTVLVNLLRITLVCLLAATAGFVPALLFHDYGGTVMTVAWLFAFWALAYRWILPQPDGAAS